MQRSAYTKAADITPHDSNVLAPGFTVKALYIGQGGDLTATVGGASVLFKAVPVGTVLPIAPTLVASTGTTAAYIRALGD